MNPPEISIIIPCLNESENLSRLIPYLKEMASNSECLEIIVVLAPSDENISPFFEKFNVREIKSDKAQRAAQMNLGAERAQADILYFLHADTLPPEGYDQDILYAGDRVDMGCFRMKFDWKNPILKFYSFFTRFRGTIFHGGDASLFVNTELFRMADGFDERMDVMEDYDLLRRLRRKAKFSVIPKYVTTSARKYRENGLIRLQWHYFMIQLMYLFGFNQEKMKNYIDRCIRP